MKASEPAGYVVYYSEQLKDEVTEGAKCYANLADAMAFINRGHFGNYTFRLFTLGTEIPLETERVEEPQPPKVATKFKVRTAP